MFSNMFLTSYLVVHHDEQPRYVKFCYRFVSALNAELDFVYILILQGMHCYYVQQNLCFGYSSTLNGRRKDVQQYCIGLHKQFF